VREIAFTALEMVIGKVVCVLHRGEGLDVQGTVVSCWQQWGTQPSSEESHPSGEESAGLVCRWFVYRRSLAVQASSE
jgi:hypothetical protein